jgi:hypothetical protein
MTNVTDTSSLRDARESLKSIGFDDLADRIDDDLTDQRETIQRVVEIKNAIAQAEEAGLDDDPAVEALRGEVEALAEEAGIAEEPSPRERLVDGYDISERAVGQMHEDDRERLVEALAGVEMWDTGSDRLEGLARHEIEARRNEIEQILDHNSVSAASLIDSDATAASGETRDLQAALAEDHTAAPGVDDDASDRVKAAALTDTREALEAERAEAENALLELELIEEIERIDERLAEVDG